MKRNYWENMAATYGDEIFDVLHNDKKALIRSVIAQQASPRQTVMDIGCAIGKWLPVLSPAFKKVIAIDISANNLTIAKKLYPQYKNVEYVRADMSKKDTKLPQVNFAICINAILTPNQKDRDIFFQSLQHCIKKGGKVVLSVPSLESWMLTSVVQQQWKIDKAYFPEEKNSKQALRKWNNIRKGNADIDDVPHHHFLKEELELIAAQNGFVAERIEKIEYSWSTEFHKPPVWLQQPGPWDWMAVFKKK